MSVEQYDPIANPYAPGAGTPPPALVGRDPTIETAGIAMQRLKAARSHQHLMITGLRGVGKTVLLGKLGSLGEHNGFRVIRVEAVGGDDTLRSLLRQCRRVAEGLKRGSKVLRALKSIDSVSLTVLGTGIEVDRVDATPDRDSLSDVVIDLAAAAADDDAGVMLAIDEAQLLDHHDLRRVLAGVHRCSQDGLPLFCVLAGLPNLVGDVAKSATYAERMFIVSELGPLTPDQIATAIVEPARELGVDWSAGATESIIDRSDGFPFFVQTWAYHTWNVARDDPISAADVARATPAAEQALDAPSSPPGSPASPPPRSPTSRRSPVSAPAHTVPAKWPRRWGWGTSQVGAFRDRLIGEGVIYAPRYGWVEFAIPHFDQYVRRTTRP
jgi:hypothetical protein